MNRPCCPKSHWSHVESPSDELWLVFSLKEENCLKIFSKWLRRCVGKKVGNGLSSRTCECSITNGSLLPSLVLLVLRVHQELHACLISSLEGRSCHLQTSYLPGILFFLEITVIQKPFWIIGVSAWLVVKWYHHVCCSDDFCRREDQLPFLSIYFWFRSVLQVLFVFVNAKVNGQALRQGSWTTVGGSVPVQAACINYA